MDAIKFKNKTDDWWKGKKVKSLVELKNSWASLPAGTIFTVERKWAGLQLRSDPCEHCGMRLYITKVPYESLEIIEITKIECPNCKSDKFRLLFYTSAVRTLVECLDCKKRYHVRRGRKFMKKILEKQGDDA